MRFVPSGGISDILYFWGKFRWLAGEWTRGLILNKSKHMFYFRDQGLGWIMEPFYSGNIDMLEIAAWGNSLLNIYNLYCIFLCIFLCSFLVSPSYDLASFFSECAPHCPSRRLASVVRNRKPPRQRVEEDACGGAAPLEGDPEEM